MGQFDLVMWGTEAFQLLIYAKGLLQAITLGRIFDSQQKYAGRLGHDAS